MANSTAYKKLAANEPTYYRQTHSRTPRRNWADTGAVCYPLRSGLFHGEPLGERTRSTFTTGNEAN